MIGDLSQDLRQVRVSGNDRIAAGLAHLSRREMLGLHGIKGATAVAVETGDCQPPKMFDQLVAVGRGDLALVRLFEGHVNAAQFVNRLGSAAQRARVATLLETGGLLGVWGADDPIQPARISMADGHNKLAGRKTYASGAGVVGLGIVAAKTEQSQTQLMLLDTTADLQSRFDASWWRPIGMQASASHALSLEGLDVSSGELFGTPGQFEAEPFFSAGAIRYVAAHLGGALALFDITREHLLRAGRQSDLLQLARLATMTADLRAAYFSVRDAYTRVAPFIAWEPPSNPVTQVDIDGSIAIVDAARLAVEAAIERAIHSACQAVGSSGLIEPHPLAGAVSDLLVYVRQPARDAAVLRLGKAAIGGAIGWPFDAA